MIFSELYSAYYNAIAAILTDILQGERSEKELQRIVAERAFGESVLTVLPALKSERWPLIHEDMTTVLSHPPTMPLTILQKQWLKAISLDPRIRLFGIEWEGLEDITPLFTAEDYCVYDKYGDGDPYEDAEYIRQFRVVLDAIRNGTQIKFEMTNRKGRTMFVRCRPVCLEYSEKDDKFRVLTEGWYAVSTVNLARIRACVPYMGTRLPTAAPRETAYDTVTLRVVNEYNALERVMLHFAHFEKQAERIDKRTYLLKVKYSLDDEPELVIRILSFGPRVEVLGSDSFRALMAEKLKKQKNCGLK